MAVGNPFAKSQGFDFVSNNKYLQEDFTGSTPLDFSNLSSSGIMSQAPAPLVYIPRDEGGDGPVDTGPTGSYDSQFDPVTENKDFVEDIGEGTIAEEDDDKTTIGPVGLAKIAGSTLFGGPFSGAFTGYREKEKAKQDAIDKINADINAQYGYGTGAASEKDMNSYETEKETGNPENYDQDYDMKDGGRAGYFFGGRVNYKVGGRVSFKNGGLASIL